MFNKEKYMVILEKGILNKQGYIVMCEDLEEVMRTLAKSEQYKFNIVSVHRTNSFYIAKDFIDTMDSQGNSDLLFGGNSGK